MTCIVKRTDPKSGNTYAYSSRSYRDPKTGKVRTEKTYLGRVDPATGDVIPKAPRGRRNRSASDRQIELASEAARERIGELEEKVVRLEERIALLESRDEAATASMRAVAESAGGFLGSPGDGEG